MLYLTFYTAAAVFDLRTGRIPNLLILMALLSGAAHPEPPFWIRFFLCLALCLPLFTLRLLGGGDGKLLALSAAWMGWPVFLRFLFFSLLTASLPSALLLLKGERGVRLPMAPCFLAGFCGLKLLGLF